MCENFDNVKVGDKVFFSMGAWHKTEYLAEVTKVTNTQFEAKGTKFRKADGRAIGQNYCTSARHATPEDIARFEEQELRRMNTNFIVGYFEKNSTLALTTADIQAIADIIKKYV